MKIQKNEVRGNRQLEMLDLQTPDQQKQHFFPIVPNWTILLHDTCRYSLPRIEKKKVLNKYYLTKNYDPLHTCAPVSVAISNMIVAFRSLEA